MKFKTLVDSVFRADSTLWQYANHLYETKVEKNSELIVQVPILKRKLSFFQVNAKFSEWVSVGTQR